MDNRNINPDFFTQKTEQLLYRLRQEIDSLLPVITPDNQDELDRYLYELNSFYYRSFSERLFPLYKSSIQDEITRLLKISSQEDMIKRDIMANIKRYAKLYNQVKNVSALFKGSRENAEEALLTVSREQDYRSAELLYTLKQVQGGFTRLEDITAKTLDWIQDKELIPAINNHPAALPVLQLISSLDRDNPGVIDALNRLLVYLAHLAKSLDRLQRQPGSKKQVTGTVNEMKARHPDFPAINEIKELTTFYKIEIEPAVNMYLEILCLACEKPDVFNQNLLDFGNWLTGLITVMEKAVSGYVPYISGNIRLNFSSVADYLKKLYEDLQSMIKAIAAIDKDLSASGEPDFTYFSHRTLETLQPILLQLKEIHFGQALDNFPGLVILLNRLEIELSLWTARIDLLNQKQEHHNEVLKQFLSIVNMLDNYLNLLANIRADLERILAPRNISRTWKDATVKVLRVPLEKNQAFPTEYLYLLDKHRIETRIAKAGEEDNLILHEEGDIFIIRVDELLEEEIPYLVIAQKG